MMHTVVIKPHQLEHYRRIREILSSWFVALDISSTGSGKTVVTTAVALSLGLSLVVIAPPIVHDQWRTTAKQYGVPLLYIASYQRLRIGGSEDSLVRRLGSDELALRGNAAPSAFEHTPFFARLVTYGILLVFDEVHMLKTDRTLQLETAHCLVRALVHNPSTVSRVSLLSATPCDKAENAVSLLKMLGILTYVTLLPDGVREIAGIAKEINPLTLAAITTEYGGQIETFSRMKPKRALQFAYEVYRDIFGPWLSSSSIHVPSVAKAVSPVEPASPLEQRGSTDITHKRLNGYYRFDAEDNARLRRAYETFASTIEASLPGDDSGAATIHMAQSLVEMESSKVKTIARLVRERLDDSKNHPNAKVIVYMNYRGPLDSLAAALSAYAPLVLNGSTSANERRKAVELFQKPSNEARLLLVHPSVGGVGVNLDDVNGGYPRTQYVSPSFSFIGICQLMGRVARTSTKSSSESYLVFSSAVPEELRLQDNLSRKARTMRDFRQDDVSSSPRPGIVESMISSPRPDQQGDGGVIRYPGEYASYSEE